MNRGTIVIDHRNAINVAVNTADDGSVHMSISRIQSDLYGERSIEIHRSEPALLQVTHSHTLEYLILRQAVLAAFLSVS